MVVPEFSRIDKIHRKTVALRCRVSIVEMRGRLRHGKADLGVANRRQIIDHPHEYRFAIARVIGWTRGNAVETPGPTAFVVGRLRMVLPTEFLFPDFVKFLWQKLIVALMGPWIGRRKKGLR